MEINKADRIKKPQHILIALVKNDNSVDIMSIEMGSDYNDHIERVFQINNKHRQNLGLKPHILKKRFYLDKPPYERSFFRDAWYYDEKTDSIQVDLELARKCALRDLSVACDDRRYKENATSKFPLSDDELIKLEALLNNLATNFIPENYCDLESLRVARDRWVEEAKNGKF